MRRVRRLCLLGLAVFALVGAGSASAAVSRGNAGAISIAPAFSSTELSAFSGDNWLTPGGGITDNRYSTLTQINRTNVAGLQVAWQSQLGIPVKLQSTVSEEASPIAYNGILYVPDGLSDVYALDGQTGQQIWKYTPTLEGTTLLGAVRGVTLGAGRIYTGQKDGSVVAIDQLTGGLVWKSKVARAADGYTFTSAPVYYNGIIMEGVSGGDLGARSFALALDANTGRELWRWYVVPGPGEYGSGGWAGTEWMHGGGAIWIYPSIDPALNLLYIVTGNPVPWNGRGVGDNLWSDSIVALHIDNGQLAWGFQTVHHDLWDYDVTNPPILFDATYGGVLRHGVAVASKTGWVYILDRATGEPLLGIAEKKVPQLKGAAGAYANTSPTQPFPVGEPFVNQCSHRKYWPTTVPAPDGHPIKVGCIFTPYAPTPSGSFLASAPAASGGVDWPPSSYNPGTGFAYLCAHDGEGNALGAVPHNQQKLVVGQGYFGINFGAATKLFADYGRLVAMNLSTNRVAWSTKWPKPCISGTMTTAGGVVFAGQTQGKVGVLQAVDATNGQVLWNSPMLAAGPNAPSMTYTAGGKQYVAIFAGGNNIIGGTKAGDSIYAFKLP
jgi:PQQ-dependent dehydrogenase (methanol/ethanol family)